ncbi:E1 ubiquitin-activating enzyme [Malassezia obtusa]|uniref:Ubiquitin-like 1-activating enzyme E1A n=1 Tax=Malassezia obtusa TaxID=76774 RepID=A0AAF0E517_9BASI|nr:E1 ubiquitin-activating enzyme [Malassezia obtusa]
MSSGVTEDEAALYDRQIRLWGLEAQNRMRSAHVVIHGLSGVATEVVKNIVLSGIGQLTVVDDGDVRDEDLGAGFFFRESDVGTSRVSDAILQRIQLLNPLVQVHGRTALDLDAWKPDVLVACTGTRSELEALNRACRTQNTMFYATAAQGWGGFLFSDLGASYTYVAERAVPGSKERKPVRYTQAFVPLDESLRTSWSAEPAPGEHAGRPVRQQSPRLWATWALWEWQARGAAQPASAEALAAALEPIVLELLARKGVDATRVFERQRVDRAAFLAEFARATLALVAHGSLAALPTTSAVLGGLLAQDLLNALGHREEPMVNWMLLDTATGQAPIHAIGTAPVVQA